MKIQKISQDILDIIARLFECRLPGNEVKPLIIKFNRDIVAYRLLEFIEKIPPNTIVRITKYNTVTEQRVTVEFTIEPVTYEPEIVEININRSMDDYTVKSSSKEPVNECNLLD
jgi:hypothetical protein